MTDITSANAVLSLTAAQVFSAPQQIQGFAADDIFDIDQLAVGEGLMGVDGLLSAGFVWEPVKQTIALQADSPSGSVFDAIYQYESQTVSKAVLSAVFKFPSLGIKFNIAKGFLISYGVMPAARRVMQPRRFTLWWQQAVMAPIAGV